MFLGFNEWSDVVTLRGSLNMAKMNENELDVILTLVVMKKISRFIMTVWKQSLDTSRVIQAVFSGNIPISVGS